MSRFYSYINTSKKIIEQYNGAVPLAAWLKDFFREHKQMGSKDRKQISSLVYNYYRLGKALPTLAVEEKLLAATFLCNNTDNALLGFLKPEWNEKINLPLVEKRLLIDGFSTATIFPFMNELSDGVDAESFALSHLQQPDLFIRIRPNQHQKVLAKLTENSIAFEQLNDNCLALNNATKIDDIIAIDKEAVVQDYSSQRIAAFLRLTIGDRPSTIWDCCAASGGKSILAKDVLGKIDLTVSDIRASIIQNLKNRFARAGINNYKSFVADIAVNSQPSTANRQLVICDAPCSGSGTWGRTPEQLSFFTAESLAKYANLQKKIISNSITSVGNNGYFLYITCSVYKQENEDAVAFIQQQFPSFQLVKKELLIGYEKKADSMFAALFKNL